MAEITFKKQFLGKWRRIDNESKKEVNEESMYRELMQLENDGWEIRAFGVTHTRMYICTKKATVTPIDVVNPS